MTLYKFTAYTRPTSTSTQNHTRVTNVAAHGSALHDAETRALELLGTAPGKREWVLELQGIEDTPHPLPHRDEIAQAIASGYEPDDPTPNRHDYRAADAVLALLAGEE